jgi:hypothetical protein
MDDLPLSLLVARSILVLLLSVVEAFRHTTRPHAEASSPTVWTTKRASAARSIRAIIFLNRSLSRRGPCWLER